MTPLLVIINPVCGSGNGKEFVHEHVLPLLKPTPPTSVFETDRAQHAGELVLGFLKKNNIRAVTVVIASGDGTVHEIINTVQEIAGEPYEIDFVLVPVRGFVAYQVVVVA
jgi:diacylglycerol kinase family enzyme